MSVALLDEKISTNDSRGDHVTPGLQQRQATKLRTTPKPSPSPQPNSYPPPFRRNKPVAVRISVTDVLGLLAIAGGTAALTNDTGTDRHPSSRPARQQCHSGLCLPSRWSLDAGQRRASSSDESSPATSLFSDESSPATSLVQRRV